MIIVHYMSNVFSPGLMSPLFLSVSSFDHKFHSYCVIEDKINNRKLLLQTYWKECQVYFIDYMIWKCSFILYNVQLTYCKLSLNQGNKNFTPMIITNLQGIQSQIVTFLCALINLWVLIRQSIYFHSTLYDTLGA